MRSDGIFVDFEIVKSLFNEGVKKGKKLFGKERF